MKTRRKFPPRGSREASRASLLPPFTMRVAPDTAGRDFFSFVVGGEGGPVGPPKVLAEVAAQSVQRCRRGSVARPRDCSSSP